MIQEMLLGCVFAYFVMAGRYLHQPGFFRFISKYMGYGVKAGLAMLLYMLLMKQYTPLEDGMGREHAMLFFWSVTILWLLAGNIRKWIAEHAKHFHLGIFAAVTPVWGFYLIEKVYNPNFVNMDVKYIAGNIIWLACLFAVLYCLFAGKRIMIKMFASVCILFGLGNYYVNCFRSSPVMPSDLLAAGTALQVAGGYVFQVQESVMEGVLCWYAGIVLLYCLPEKRIFVKRWQIQAAVTSLVIGICAGYLYGADIEGEYELDLRYDNQWNINAVYQEKGSVLGFTVLSKNLQGSKPDGYSTGRAQEILSGHRRQKDETAVTPTIIAIMDESFSDFRSVGDFQCSEEYLERWHAVDDPVILCIFGDHLPNVSAWIEDMAGKREDMFTLEEKQKMYAVPYMIWANYDTPYESREMDTSANYLGAMLLAYAGIQGTDYTDFLLEMGKEVPVYNAFGYQTPDGNWHSFDEETEVSDWIRDYRIVQYYEMFDDKK
ncbi:hypothetical protein C823_000101 [Eubacterium plexicaudatum ASF492]|nr:hypothetical protein C823_000101 [Eubacterium plexicaudatum ASF492]